MKIKAKTKWQRRAFDIHFSNKHHDLTPIERESTVAGLRMIAVLADLAARIIEAESPSITNAVDGDDGWIDLCEMDTILWTRCGKGKFRLTHAGMAAVHDLHAVLHCCGSRFPDLAELGFKIR